ncbi:MAG: VOC family protein [Pseudomonadota bacterium]
MSTTHGLVWWSELMTGDVTGCRAYYETVCGWRFEEMPMGDGVYLIAHAHGKPVAGMMDTASLPSASDRYPHWMTYLAVDDVDSALERAKAAGGHVEREPFEVPGVGRIAIARDAGGAVVGLMTPVTQWDADAPGEPSLENVPV